MEKKSFKKKRSVKEQDRNYKEHFEILDEKYSKLKDIMKHVLNDLNGEKEIHRLLRTEYETLVLEMKEKDALLERVQSVSEAVIDEYNALKVKCDLEVEAATNASKRATRYFEENRKLKGSSQLELEDNQIYDSIEFSSQEPESVSELDMLNNLASELRTEIASLKVQLMKEIEKQNSLKEDFEIATDLYEKEMKEHNDTREKLESLQLDYNRQVITSHQPEALETAIEQSTMNHEQGEESIHQEESIYEDYDVQTVDDNTHSAAASLDLVEQLENFRNQNNVLNTRIQELEFENRKLRAEASASMSLPIPPPPPPPPLPPSSFNPIKSLITFIHAGKKSAKTKKENVETQQQKAMSEMINAIKKGQVHLKPTPKTFPLQSPKEEDSAVGEMKNIWSSLKRKDKVLKEGQALQGIKCLDESYVQENDKTFSIAGDVEEELKMLLRKRSLKSITDPSSCAMSVSEIKSNSSDDTSIDHQEQCHISSLSELVFDGENHKDHLMENKAECPLYDSVITRKNQNLKDTQSFELSDLVFDGKKSNVDLVENKAECPLYDSVITCKNQNIKDAQALVLSDSVFNEEKQNDHVMKYKAECSLYDCVIPHKNPILKDAQGLERPISDSDSEVES